ncbi:MAG: hypothetical protein ACRES8_05215 [Nevskiaceae bacterium]
MQNYVRAFVAGFLSTLVFHQAVVGLFYVAGLFPAPPFNLDPRAPFGVPAVLSLAFWGGLWGMPIWYLMRHATGKAYWLRAVVFGAIFPTAAALLFFFPIKNDWSFARAAQPVSWLFGFIVNGAWGLGLALLMRGLRRVGL